MKKESGGRGIRALGKLALLVTLSAVSLSCQDKDGKGGKAPEKQVKQSKRAKAQASHRTDAKKTDLGSRKTLRTPKRLLSLEIGKDDKKDEVLDKIYTFVGRDALFILEQGGTLKDLKDAKDEAARKKIYDDKWAYFPNISDLNHAHVYTKSRADKVEKEIFNCFVLLHHSKEGPIKEDPDKKPDDPNDPEQESFIPVKYRALKTKLRNILHDGEGFDVADGIKFGEAFLLKQLNFPVKGGLTVYFSGRSRKELDRHPVVEDTIKKKTFGGRDYWFGLSKEVDFSAEKFELCDPDTVPEPNVIEDDEDPVDDEG